MKKILTFLFISAFIFNINAQNQIKGHEYVDLGLSVKWATCNVGANQPYEYGDFYLWGKISTETDNTYTYGEYDIGGNRRFDVARAKWTGSWRMPTRREILELVTNCKWQWTSINGVKGCKVIGPNGNSIFLPAAGDSDAMSRRNIGKYGTYWSSTPDGNVRAYVLYISPEKVDIKQSYRENGKMVRPVSD